MHANPKSEESNGCLMIKVGVVGRADERPIGNSTAIGLAACQKLRIIQCEAVSDEKPLSKELCWHFDDSINNKLSVRLSALYPFKC